MKVVMKRDGFVVPARVGKLWVLKHGPKAADDMTRYR